MTNFLFLVEIFELTDPNLAYLFKEWIDENKLKKKNSHKSMWLLLFIFNFQSLLLP